jgi:hypothetical protein
VHDPLNAYCLIHIYIYIYSSVCRIFISLNNYFVSDAVLVFQLYIMFAIQIHNLKLGLKDNLISTALVIYSYIHMYRSSFYFPCYSFSLDLMTLANIAREG